MAATKQHVTIKGVKEGLIFIMDDTCRYDELLEELQHKLEKTHDKILAGPLIHVYVKLGNRWVSEEDKEQIRSLIAKRGNLLVQAIDSDVRRIGSPEDEPGFKVWSGIIRSGQTVEFDGSLLLLGDVNPGGSIVATGSILIMGSLRGLAHAGVKGDETAVIAASHFRPTQLRIANVISRPPDEWGIEEAIMEFAYIQNGMMEIDKIHHLHRIRPDITFGIA